MCASTIDTLGLVTDMTLLTEGGCCAGENYKHYPADGGDSASALLLGL